MNFKRKIYNKNKNKSTIKAIKITENVLQYSICSMCNIIIWIIWEDRYVTI